MTKREEKQAERIQELMSSAQAKAKELNIICKELDRELETDEKLFAVISVFAEAFLLFPWTWPKIVTKVQSDLDKAFAFLLMDTRKVAEPVVADFEEGKIEEKLPVCDASEVAN